jgi:hypothetical protein
MLMKHCGLPFSGNGDIVPNSFVQVPISVNGHSGAVKERARGECALGPSGGLSGLMAFVHIRMRGWGGPDRGSAPFGHRHFLGRPAGRWSRLS